MVSTVVESGIHDHPVKPCRKLCLAPKLAELRQQLEKDFLTDVTGRRVIPAAVQRDRVHAMSTELEELRKGMTISGRARGQELRRHGERRPARADSVGSVRPRDRSTQHGRTIHPGNAMSYHTLQLDGRTVSFLPRRSRAAFVEEPGWNLRQTRMTRLHMFVALSLVISGVDVPTTEPSDPLRRQANPGVRLRATSDGRIGAEVASVDSGGPFSSSLRQGDRVFKINDTLLTDDITLQTMLASLRGGDTVRFQAARGSTAVNLQAELPAAPRERIEGLEVLYDSVLTDQGHRLRTIVTRPAKTTGRLPGLFLVGWISCDSVESPFGTGDGFSRLLHGVATGSGMVMMRVDKSGVGDSEGPACAELDFRTELADYRSALRRFAEYDFVDPDRIFLLGMSNGGGFAPLVAEAHPVAGIISSGGWAKTWFEHMIENERRNLAASGLDPAEVSNRMRGYSEFYSWYLSARLTPEEVVRQHPHLASLWTDAPRHQYGRPAAFFHQLQALNLEGAWAKVGVPVLVVYGEYDRIMSRDDNDLIVELVNRHAPGSARLAVIPRMDHGYLVHESMEQSIKAPGKGRFDLAVVTLIVDWLKAHSG